MTNNLTFNRTLTVEQFKAEHKVSRIDVKQNPNTNKLFFVFGTQTGAVATAGIPKNPMFSNVTGDNGENFWLLHEEGKGSAPTLATL